MNPAKSLIIIGLVALALTATGCSKPLQLKITSEPNGAEIYRGQDKKAMEWIGVTPHRALVEGKVHPAECYRLRKVGFEDSEVVCYPPSEDKRRRLHVKLKPKPEDQADQERAALLDSKYAEVLEIIKKAGPESGLRLLKGRKILIIKNDALWFAAPKAQIDSFTVKRSEERNCFYIHLLTLGHDIEIIQDKKKAAVARGVGTYEFSIDQLGLIDARNLARQAARLLTDIALMEWR